jgi:hypothetical protein
VPDLKRTLLNIGNHAITAKGRQDDWTEVRPAEAQSVEFRPKIENTWCDVWALNADDEEALKQKILASRHDP